MAISLRAVGAPVALATRTNTTVPAPAGTTTGDVVVVCMTAGVGSATAVTITAPSGWELVGEAVYSDTDPWAVRQAMFARVHDGAASWVFTHASASAQAWAMSLTGVDNTTIQDVASAATLSGGTSATIAAPSLTIATAGAWSILHRGSWDGNAITPPTDWTERLDVPVHWVGTREWVAPGATGTIAVLTGNGSLGSPESIVHGAFRPAGGGGPSPVTGSLAASTPALTVGPMTVAISGTVTAPTWAGSLAASLPAVAVGPSTSSISGTVTPPTYSGTLTADAPEITVGPPTATISGTATAPAGSGSLTTDLPEITIGPATLVMSGTITVPTYSGTLAADLPEVTAAVPELTATGTFIPPGGGVLAAGLPTIIIGPPTVDATGTVSVPTWTGDLEASLPTVTVGAPMATMSGTVTAPVVTGTLAANLPGITVGPATATILDESIPALPARGVTLRGRTQSRGLIPAVAPNRRLD